MDMPLYDPAKQAGSPLFHPDGCYCLICGPGGNNTLTENNEKGIQETGVMGFVMSLKPSNMPSDNDLYRQGIYTTNSMGDND